MTRLMQRDANSNVIQGYFTDPNKCLGAKNAGVIYKKNPTAGDLAVGILDITGWLALVLYPATDGTLEYNGDNTKIQPIYGGMKNEIMIHSGVTQIKVNPACDAVCGM